MGQTILLIDDSAILRRIATNVLGGNPVRYDVVTAARATEGFARACGANPDLILVDAHLAGTVKAELCQRLLAEPRTSGVPVVLLMRRGTQPPALKDLPDNVIDTLTKPFTPEQLVASVKSILQMIKENAGFSSIRAQLQGDKIEAPVLVDRKAVATAVTSNTRKINRDRLEAISTTRFAVRENIAAPEARPTARTLRGAFQKAAEEGLCGVLSLKMSDRPLLDVYFDAGNLVAVSTRDAVAYSHGAREVLPPKVSPATLEAALDDQSTSGVPFFLTLGARGLLSKAAAVSLLHRFGQKFFSRAWELRSAKLCWEFTRLVALPGFALRLEPRRESIDEWLLDTLRSLSSEDVAASAKHDGFVGTPLMSRQGQIILHLLKLTDQEKEFVRRVNGRTDLPSIANAIGVSSDTAYLFLYRFRALEAMDYRPAPAAFVVTPRTNVRRVLPLHR